MRNRGLAGCLEVTRAQECCSLVGPSAYLGALPSAPVGGTWVCASFWLQHHGSSWFQVAKPGAFLLNELGASRLVKKRWASGESSSWLIANFKPQGTLASFPTPTSRLFWRKAWREQWR